MTRCTAFVTCVLLGTLTSGTHGDTPRPIAGPDLVFQERDGIAAVEAEHFHRQTRAEVRAWHLTSPQHTPAVAPDGDPPHTAGASGGAYLEILPDTRRTHDDPLVPGENFTNEPGCPTHPPAATSWPGSNADPRGCSWYRHGKWSWSGWPETRTRRMPTSC